MNTTIIITMAKEKEKGTKVVGIRLMKTIISMAKVKVRRVAGILPVTTPTERATTTETARGTREAVGVTHMALFMPHTTMAAKEKGEAKGTRVGQSASWVGCGSRSSTSS